MFEEDMFALFKRLKKLKSKDDSVTSAAINVFNKLGEPNISGKKKYGYLFQTFVINRVVISKYILLKTST